MAPKEVKKAPTLGAKVELEKKDDKMVQATMVKKTSPRAGNKKQQGNSSEKYGN